MIGRILLPAVLILSACSPVPVKTENIHYWNRDLSERVFTAKTDLPSGSFAAGSTKSPVFRKGDKIRIWTEGGSEWFRIKAYKAAENREQAHGKVILYLFYKDVLSKKSDNDKSSDAAFILGYIISQTENLLASDDGKPVLKTADNSGS